MADETSQGSEAIAATARLLGGGLAAVVAVAGTFGATTGGLARLLRNDQVAMGLALAAAGLAVVAATVAAMYPSQGEVTRAWRNRTALLAVGGALLLLALVNVVRAQTVLSRTPYRPQVSVSFASPTTVKVSATADSLRIGDRLSVSVLGTDPYDRLVQYFVGNVGANSDGVARQEAEARVAQRPDGRTVQVVAVVRQKPNPGEVVDCEGNVLAANGTPTGTKVEPACLVFAPPRVS